MRKEIGHTRGQCPYTHFLCLNSGSESVGLAARIADINTKLQTDPGAAHAGKAVKRIVVKGSFHGRTERPALYSDSTRKAYVQHLASYRDETSVLTVPAYDMDALRKLFADAERFSGFEVAAVERHLILNVNAPAGRIFFDVLHVVADLAL